MHTLDAAISTIHKNYGKAAGGKGFQFPKFKRLPTGILPLDVGLAGGIPLGAVSIFYGPEGSGKTSLALRTVAQFQRRNKDRKAVWIDVENAYDPELAAIYGVDTEELYLLRPTTAEEAADMAGEVAFSEDVGLVVIDSIAALASIDQLEKSATQRVIAGSTMASTNLCRKIASGMVEHSKHGQPLTVVYINQVRTKIGVVFGNPEILPGPSMQNYQAFLKLRLTSSPVLKEKVALVPVYNDHTATVKKKKFPCIRQATGWQMMLTHYKGHKPFDVNNHKHAEKLLDEAGMITKSGKEWVLGTTGEGYPTKTAAIEQALVDYDFTLDALVETFIDLYQDDIVKNLSGDED